MIEKDIFQAIQGVFNVSATLREIKLWSFASEENPKPFVIFQGEGTGENTALIQLVIESEYRGMAECSALKKEIRTVLALPSSHYGGFNYAFKEENTTQKKHVLTFRVKRFKI